jgi:hypothetical protein
MWRLFRPRKYRGQNKRHGFLKEYLEKEEVSEDMSFSSPSLSSFTRGFTNFSEGVLALIKIRETFSSLCLGVSSRTRRVVNLFALQVVVTPVKWIALKHYYV